MVGLTAWGRLGTWNHDVLELDHAQPLPAQIAARLPGIAHGMGRSYGDVALNPGGHAWKTTGLDRFLQFDEASGRLRCEAGVLLRDIQRLMVPRGWSLPVVPGTQWVTVGGAIANDVHGKNHHRFGSFGDHVARMRLLRTDGELIDCGPALRPEWFAATVGGLGLTGLITEAELQLKRQAGPWLDAETLPFAGLDAFFALAQSSEADWEHTVAWIDCLSFARGGAPGRGLFMRANAAAAGAGDGARAPRERQWSVPAAPPVSLVNRWSLRPFNAAYFALNKSRTGRRTVHSEPFFYPLDGVQHWNRLYGPRGFYQYQCVVPPREAAAATAALLAEIARANSGSFLAVLKTFGERAGPGLLSFARPGTTLALDFPNDGASTLQLFERLDAILRESGGAIYPAKDARMPRDLFEAGYPRHADFRAFRDPGIESAFFRRVMA
ncbi:FAD-binding oxidoreductase [Aquabacterium humicola]|uniref:FAD-binding oxidoreductase n=1 Tax=Aquabacterium humicola TaxID=3237377 RepID=UPI0025429405|nr:FAD-binding oxidoreductase [Rubrivivax pictus]